MADRDAETLEQAHRLEREMLDDGDVESAAALHRLIEGYVEDMRAGAQSVASARAPQAGTASALMAAMLAC